MLRAEEFAVFHGSPAVLTDVVAVADTQIQDQLRHLPLAPTASRSNKAHRVRVPQHPLAAKGGEKDRIPWAGVLGRPARLRGPLNRIIGGVQQNCRI